MFTIVFLNKCCCISLNVKWMRDREISQYKRLTSRAWGYLYLLAANQAKHVPNPNDSSTYVSSPINDLYEQDTCRVFFCWPTRASSQASSHFILLCSEPSTTWTVVRLRDYPDTCDHRHVTRKHVGLVGLSPKGLASAGHRGWAHCGPKTITTDLPMVALVAWR